VIMDELLVIVAALLFQSPADSLRDLARGQPQSDLVLEARARPMVVREAVAAALAVNDFETARRLAAAQAVAWNDSFLVREVVRFESWPHARRTAKRSADSIRIVGNEVYGQAGARAAIRIWRRALSRATTIGDTAGMAAVLGNIGAGFLEESRLDSAVAYLERARALAARVGDRRVEANALGSLAGVSEERSDIAGARRRIAQAITLRQQIGDTRGMAADRNNLGLLAQTTGDMEEARRQFEAALELNRRERNDQFAATNLVNLAGLESLSGDFERAESLYRQALTIWRAREMWAEAADALRGLGELEARRGDYPAARTALVEALEIYQRTGSVPDVLTVRRELAAVLAAQGHLQAALDAMRDAEGLADSTDASVRERAGLVLTRADLALGFNNLNEAERLYSRAEALYREAGDQRGLAEAQQGRGFLFLERANYARAQTLLQSAWRIQLAAGDRRAAALTRVSLGELARARGDTVGARIQLRRAISELEDVGDPVAVAWTMGRRAALDAAVGMHAAAQSLYRRALARLGDLEAPEISWQLRAGLGTSLRAQGMLDESARQLRAAAAEIDRPRRSLTLAERRSGFLADKWDVYAQLALVEHARGLPGAAFEASEQLRAREMLELLALGRISAPPGTPTEVTREQDLRRRISELTAQLEGGLSVTKSLRGRDLSTAGGATREALLRVQSQYAELLLELKERASQHAALVTHEIVSWREIARRLRRDEVLVEYLVSDSASVAFVVRSDTLAVVDLGVTRKDLARLVEFARATLQPSKSASTDSLWRGSLQRLHTYLIAPIEASGMVEEAKRLVLVPHAELHYLPFAALLASDQAEGRGRFLVERYDLLVTPSATVWLTLGDRPAGRATAGVLAFAPRTGNLPATRREVSAIARLLSGEARVLTDDAATEEAFRRDAPAHRVLHLATYGVLNKQNPLFSFVELAPAGVDDGRLEVHEVLGLRLAADLVVLSACETALGSGRVADLPPGEDWVSLTRAFLHAGAAHVVATLWLVEDQATASLMEQFYRTFAAGAHPAEALSRAQRALLASPHTAHPFYWAAFVNVGSAENARR
jgi:CHAT domain-containing protein